MNDKTLDLTDKELAEFLKERRKKDKNMYKLWEKQQEFYEKRAELREIYNKITPEDKQNAIDFEAYCHHNGLFDIEAEDYI